MAFTLARFPAPPNKPQAPVVERWFTAIVAAVNALLTGTQVGAGDPEGVIVAPQGSLWRRTDGGSGTSVYVKTSGGIDPNTLTDTGWEAL